MELFLLLTINFFDLAISAVLFAMMGRVIMSVLMIGEDSKIAAFLYAITEPFIIPVRVLFEKFGWFQGTPLDMSFFFTSLILCMISTGLSLIPI